MNNIYKVIWSKAKNCYVVASEIARSHTKSATGSGKIGGVTRRSLLASLMALSLLCGGLGVASAEVDVKVDVSSAPGAVEVYTKTGVDTLLNDKADKTALGTKANATEVVKNTTDIATNKANITALQSELGNKADKSTVTTALDAKADATALNGKANTDLSNLTADGVNKIKETMSADMEKKANKDTVTALVGRVGGLESTVGGASGGLVKGVADLNAKTTKITYDAALGTSVDGVTFNAGKVTNVTSINGTEIGTNVDGNYIHQDSSIWGNMKNVDTQVKINADNIETNKNAITNLDAGLQKEVADREAADAEINKKIGSIDNNQTEYVKEDQTISQNLTKLDNKLKDTNDRTGGITRNDAESKTIIEKKVTVDSNGNVTAEGKLKAGSVDAGAITTTGAVNAGSLIVTDASNLKGDVTMDKTLSVTGDTKLGALNVTGESSLKDTQVNGTLTTTGKATFKEAVEMDKGLTVTSGDTTLQNTDVKGALNVTGESSLKDTQVNGTLTTTGKATFKEAVEMDKGLTVTSGDTTLQNTDVKGALNVTGESSLKNTTVGGTLGVTGETTLNDKLTAKGEATFEKNVTVKEDLTVKGELKTDKISMKNTDTDPDGTIHRSATTITADGITHNGEVEKSGVITKSQFTHTEEGSETYAKKGNTANWTETRSDVKADGVKTKVEDSKKNRTNTSQTADGIKGYATDKDGNRTYTKVTATENSFQVQDKDGKNKNHQVNTMGSSVTEIKNDEGKITKTEQTAENITNTAKDGTIKNDAKDIVNNASGNISNKSQTMDTTVTGKATESYGSLDTTVNGNETHIVKGTKTETVDGKVTENYNAGQATKVTGNQDIHVTGKQTNTVEGGQENIISGGQINSITGDQTTTVTGDISNKAKNITNEAETKLTDKVGTNTRVLDSEGITDTVPGADGKGSTFKQRIDAIMGNVKTDAGESEVTQTGDEITSKVGLGEATNSRVTQKKNLLEAAVTDGTNYNISNDTANESAKELRGGTKVNRQYDNLNGSQKTIADGANTNLSIDTASASAKALTDGTKVNKQQDNLDSSEKTITNGTYKTSKVQTALDITNTASDGTITNDAKNIVNNATGDMTNTVGGKQTNKIDGDQVNTIGGSQTTTVTGDISNTAKNITNEANTKLTDKVGTNTRVLDSEGITDTVPGAGGKGSTFKQRIDAIMGNVKTDAGESEVTQKGDEITSVVGKGEATNSRVTQKKGSLEAGVTDGTNTNASYDVADASAKVLSGGTKVNKLQDNLDSSEKTITNGTYTTSKLQTALDITNTAKDGTITNDAKNIVNNATGDMTNTVGGKLTTTVTGQATENFKGGLKTDITGEEIHTVTGNQTNKVTGKQTNTVEGGQENIISGGQINNITGDQTTTISGTQTTTARDINRNASSGMIDTIDNAYGTNTETKVAGKTTTDVSIKGTGEKGQYIRGANESRDYLIKGTLKNSETKTAEATSTKITDGNGKTSSTIQDVTQISGSVTDGTNTSVSNVKANSIDSAVTDGSSISTINQKKNSITSQVTDGTTITKTEQDTKNITNTAKDGIITNDAKDIVNNASGNMTNTVGGDLKTTVSGNELHEVTGKQTNKIDGDQENTIGGNQTTTVTGDISNTAENITNEANTKLTDKVGENTRVLDSEGITDTVGGSTFKQRIDKIMMESKDVSIKAEETLTNEAKVITNKASEVINNEAVNINNTATGIITSKASEIKNQADKLISNKVGENTWENMENGKITTSIKDGAKQNLTQSDAAGTTQSTVDGGKSTVTIQNADGLADAVTDGTNTSVQNQTASAIAAAVKDGAGNENASAVNATTSVNTIKSGSKANTVISTADGTSFINSEAAAPVGDGTEVKTTIKGNTITTGKVTMDYAEVMKDLGVRGNANITGKTTTGSLEVTGTSTLKGDVTMGSNATVKKDLTVEGNTNLKNTKVDGTLDVTQKANFGDSVSIAKDLSVGGNATIKGDVTASSYKVGDKTYISAAGINANDQKITNVADGSISEGSKDAVNGGQLYTVKNDLEGKVNKVGANAAAMANLHPMEFDPDSKWNIAAAIGNYGSETAAALGAFYRPNDDVMVNLSTAFGTGENMVGGGVSVRLGKGGNKLSREENNALKDQVDNLTARMDALLSVLNPNMSKDFPDVPENHWAYEAVSRLAGNDIVQGYPDGEFHGDRTMTRYEMAEIIYNALSRGAEAEKELVEEFKPELQAMAASEKATAEKAEG